ncbi:hypothetical protein QR680_017603 [Steinernema hermaphroditum]|uniref:Saposin B-type domain-containing protein n=1 Tax=Steinernema hermaphroditum TaxID=289476 RepID=A0AA39HF63_9BILA|nr:hypothetical protein QR680_017603 [Steinernema hermaphroditum]
MRFSSLLLLCALVTIAVAFPKKAFKEEHGLLKPMKGADCEDGANCVCGPCKDVVAFLRTMILEHKTQDKELLEKACLRFYGNDPARKGFCEKVVEEHLSMILDYVRQKIDPVDVCKLFC